MRIRKEMALLPHGGSAPAENGSKQHRLHYGRKYGGKEGVFMFSFSPTKFGKMEFGGVKRRKRRGRRKQKKLVSCWLHFSCENTLKNKVLAI